MYSINQYHKRLTKLAEKTGHNAYLVIRDGIKVETTVLKVGDSYLQLAKGVNGAYENGCFIDRSDGIVRHVSKCPFN